MDRRAPLKVRWNGKGSSDFPKSLYLCAQHGRWLEGERPLWRLIALTISREQGRHREVGSEGSWRQTCDLMNKKLIRGCEAGRAGK
jgi:hypothetical protein